MNRISALFGLILLMLFWNAHSSNSALAGTYDESFRCGTDVIMLGDSNYRVLAKCGPPGVKEAVGTNYMYGGQPPAGEFRDMENWTYNRGPTDFVYTLKFQGGSLIEIFRGGRGF
jgi:hypothetical protein